MKNHQFLHQPLLPSAAGTLSGGGATTPSAAHLANTHHHTIPMSSTRTIVLRLLSVLLIGLISIFADHEASKGFDITTVNDARDTPAGRRFHLLFVSNDKVTRLVLNANNFVQNTLHPKNNEDNTSIKRVTIHFTSQNLSQIAAVDSDDGRDFVINVSSSIMEELDVVFAMTGVIQRAMTKIWMWNRHDHLTDSMVECITMLSGLSSGDEDLNPSPERSKKVRKVAKFLHYCEGKEKGFIGRLDRVLREDRTVGDDEMGLKRSIEGLCGSYSVTDLSI